MKPINQISVQLYRAFILFHFSIYLLACNLDLSSISDPFRSHDHIPEEPAVSPMRLDQRLPTPPDTELEPPIGVGPTQIETRAIAMASTPTRLATSTRMYRLATHIPTPTLILPTPTLIPILPTPTLIPILPTPTLIPILPTPTLIPPAFIPRPTATATHRPTATAMPTIPPTPSSTPTGFGVRLKSPINDVLEGIYTFSWEPFGVQLQPNQAYEVVFWEPSAGGQPMTNSFAAVGPTTETQIVINFDHAKANLSYFQSGRTYQWGILLVETNPYRRLTHLGGHHQFYLK